MTTLLLSFAVLVRSAAKAAELFLDRAVLESKDGLFNLMLEDLDSLVTDESRSVSLDDTLFIYYYIYSLST